LSQPGKPCRPGLLDCQRVSSLPEHTSCLGCLWVPKFIRRAKLPTGSLVATAARSERVFMAACAALTVLHLSSKANTHTCTLSLCMHASRRTLCQNSSGYICITIHRLWHTHVFTHVSDRVLSHNLPGRVGVDRACAFQLFSPRCMSHSCRHVRGVLVRLREVSHRKHAIRTRTPCPRPKEG
jgi:hypothetical protein